MFESLELASLASGAKFFELLRAYVWPMQNAKSLNAIISKYKSMEKNATELLSIIILYIFFAIFYCYLYDNARERT